AAVVGRDHASEEPEFALAFEPRLAVIGDLDLLQCPPYLLAALAFSRIRPDQRRLGLILGVREFHEPPRSGTGERNLLLQHRPISVASGSEAEALMEQLEPAKLH